MTTTIIGVDFSGAKEDKATWKTEATLQGSVLKITDCSCIKRKDLTDFLLESLPDDNTTVALDFPFALPLAFAQKIAPKATTMPDVWEAVNAIGYQELDERRRDFVKHYGEIIRKGDAHFGGPFSPLKTVNPNMLPMTFYGMKMLHRLWKSKREFRVPPLSEDLRNGPTLLETMPGVWLRAFALPAVNYKTKNGKDVREKILVGLEQRFRKSLKISSEEREKCLNNPDCLDSLVAAIGGAEWVKDSSKFLIPRDCIPPSEELDLAKLEGWIYAPQPNPN